MTETTEEVIAALTVKLTECTGALIEQSSKLGVALAERDGMRLQFTQAVHVARDLITWARASGVKESAVIDAESRLARISPRPMVSHACVTPDPQT